MVGYCQVLCVIITLVHGFTVDRSVNRGVVGVSLTGFRVYDAREVSLRQALVIGLFGFPVIVEIVVSHFQVVLTVSLAVLTILEWESPSTVRDRKSTRLNSSHQIS